MRKPVFTGTAEHNRRQQRRATGAPLEFPVLDKGSNGVFASVRADPATYTGACPKARKPQAAR